MEDGATSATVAQAAPDRPAVVTYTCGDAGTLTVETVAQAVVVTDASGEPVELPASPAGQQARYGRDSHALVLENGEAFYMKAGDPPLTCTR